MTKPDHRSRVAAERRERMRTRLLGAAMQLVAAKGPAESTIDDVILAAGVSRGSFYKYYPTVEALVRELAIEITNGLIQMAEQVISGLDDPAERVACGIRLFSRLAIDHPLLASCLVRMGWPEERGPQVQFEFVLRDLEEGIRKGRFKPMPIRLALNIVTGSVMGAIYSMLQPDSEPDFAELTAEAALRGLGLDSRSALRLSTRPLITGDGPSLRLQVLAPAGLRTKV